jgi:hypothetical protein
LNVLVTESTPSIRTGEIKILTKDRGHRVRRPPGTVTAPSRLGTVGEFSIDLVRRHALSSGDGAGEEGAKVSATIRSAAEDAAAPTDTKMTEALERIVASLSATHHALVSLRLPLWLGVGLLTLILWALRIGD